MSTGVREPIAAGIQYSGDPQQLRADIDAMLSMAVVDMGSPKVLIVPHAAYDVSGATAATGYGLLAAERGKIERVIVLSPCHGLSLEGLALPRNIAFRTPLGDVLLDQNAAARLLTSPAVTMSDRHHARELGIELQIPFIQRMIGRVTIVPVLVGDMSASALANVLELVWGGPETLIVASVDLSHGLTHERAAATDRATAASIIDLSLDGINGSVTCAAPLLRGLLSVARRRGMVPSVLATSTSADADGQTEAVTGFGSFGLWESPTLHIEEADVAHLLTFAQSIARTTALGGEVAGAAIDRVPSGLHVRRGSFVNVFVNGELRNSAGNLEASTPLASAVARHVAQAVSGIDPPVGIDELGSLSLEVTILSALERLLPTSVQELVQSVRPGVDGLLLRSGRNRATFLPAVWETLSDPLDFVGNLFSRAQIDPSTPIDEVIVHRYSGLTVGGPSPQL